MKGKHSLLLICIAVCLMLTACKNETVILDDGENKIKVENSKNEEDKKEEQKNQENKKDDSKKVISTVVVADNGIGNSLEKIEEIHPNSYIYADKEDLLKKGEEIFSNKDENDDNYIFVKKFMALYGDVGIEVESSKAEREKMNLHMTGDAHGIFVSQGTGYFKSGDKVTKIAGVDIDTLIDQCKEFYPEGNRGSVLENIDDLIRDRSFLEYIGEVHSDKVQIEVLRKNIMIIDHVGFVLEKTKNSKKNGYDIYKDNDIALLTINSYKGEDDSDGNATIDGFFRDSKLLSSKKVVIDFRNSEEVDLGIVREIGAYLQGEEYNVFKKTLKKSGEREAAGYKGKSILNVFSIFKGNNNKIKDKEEKIFKGELYVLLNKESSEDSYNAATILAEDFGAEIVGSAEALDGIGFGDYVSIENLFDDVKIKVPTAQYTYTGDISGENYKKYFTYDLSENKIQEEKLVKLLHR